MKKIIFLAWLIVFSSTACSPYLLFNHNVLDFSPGGSRNTSMGLIGYSFIPYRIYVSFAPTGNQRISTDFGEREFGVSYMIRISKRKWLNIATGLNVHVELEGGIRLLTGESDNGDYSKTPSNMLVELPFSLTYMKRKAIGWINIKPGIWFVDGYAVTSDIIIKDYKAEYGDYRYTPYQQQIGVTAEAGFGYYDPDGFTALLVFNRPFYYINGDLDAFSFLGIIAGVNFAL